MLIVVSPEATALDLRESVTVKLDEKAADEAQIEILSEFPKSPAHLAVAIPRLVLELE